jgi:hypothetical protein
MHRGWRGNWIKPSVTKDSDGPWHVDQASHEYEAANPMFRQQIPQVDSLLVCVSRGPFL